MPNGKIPVDTYHAIVQLKKQQSMLLTFNTSSYKKITFLYK